MNDALSEPERNGSSAISASRIAGRDHRGDDRVAIARRGGLEVAVRELDASDGP